MVLVILLLFVTRSHRCHAQVTQFLRSPFVGGPHSTDRYMHAGHVQRSKVRLTSRCFSACICKDLSIYGLFNTYLAPIDVKQTAQIYAKCFDGVGLTSCKPVLPTDDEVLRGDLPYYKNLVSNTGKLS
jgi:hypothetical protein